MALDKDFDGNNDIAQFLEKFKEQPFPPQAETQAAFASPESSVRPAQYARSFEKLEQKIHELEEKFEASTTQNQLILSELARTREVVERQKDKDAFLEHLSRTIATLRTSVENLSRTQQGNTFGFRPATTQRSFDPLPDVFSSIDLQEQPLTDTQAQLERERNEQTRRFNSLRQKASQLKAVNSALDREIKKAQQEKMEALKKTADQAKEILSLRDQLSAAEERFKSFDFEGRIISIKQEYQQKVTSLESRLKEVSDTCMKQVEEIETLKAENTKLQNISAEKEMLQAQLADKEQELRTVKNTIASLQNQSSGEHTKRLVAFTAQLRMLEEQRDRLAVELEQSQMSLETIKREKEILEKNFKELVLRINKNDSVIGQLKQKIEVLATQNTQLTQHNEELTQNNALLSQDNATLSQSNVELTNRNAALTQHNQQLLAHNTTLAHKTQTLEKQASVLKEHVTTLNQDKQTLEKQTNVLKEHVTTLSQDKQTLLAQTQKLEGEKQTLSAQVKKLHQDKDALSQDKETLTVAHADLKAKAQNWKKEAQTLSDENQQLRNQSAALLAARLVQEHSQKQAVARAKQEVADNAEQADRPAAPVLHSLGRKIKGSSHEEEEWEIVSAKVNPSSDKKVTVQTVQDLPEIKVAQPLQDPLFDSGEDFLEKTDSFIGRMKWSIFRENR